MLSGNSFYKASSIKPPVTPPLLYTRHPPFFLTPKPEKISLFAKNRTKHPCFGL